MKTQLPLTEKMLPFPECFADSDVLKTSWRRGTANAISDYSMSTRKTNPRNSNVYRAAYNTAYYGLEKMFGQRIITMRHWIVSCDETVIAPRVLAASPELACDVVRRQWPNRLAVAKLHARLCD